MSTLQKTALRLNNLLVMSGLPYDDRQKRAAELRGERVSVAAVSETPPDELLLVSTLATAEPALYASLPVECLERIERRTEAAFRQRQFSDVREVALIHARGNLAFAAGHERFKFAVRPPCSSLVRISKITLEKSSRSSVMPEIYQLVPRGGISLRI